LRKCCSSPLPMRYRIKAIIHPSKYGSIMNSLITDSYLLSITRNPHISRATSCRAFAFAALQIYSRSTRCANIQYRTIVSHPSRHCVSGRRIYLSVAQHPQPMWWLQDYVLTSLPVTVTLPPCGSIRHANVFDWIFEGAAWRRRNPTSYSPIRVLGCRFSGGTTILRAFSSDPF